MNIFYGTKLQNFLMPEGFTVNLKTVGFIITKN